MKYASIFALLATATSILPLQAAPIPVTDPAAIQSAIDDAVDGGLVEIGPGSATWTSSVRINHPVHVVGSGQTGANATTITRDWGAVAGNHVVFDVKIPHSGDDNPWFEISNMTLKNVFTQGAGGTGNGLIQVGAQSTAPYSLLLNGRVHHVTFEAKDATMMFPQDCFMVIDHCRFILHGTAQVEETYAKHVASEITGYSNNIGGGPWNDTSHQGTGKAVYYEDNVVTTFAGDKSNTTFDGTNGARYVVRHNRSTVRVGGHGTESGGNQRGSRSVESYNNIFSGTSTETYSNSLDQARAGTKTCFNNVGALAMVGAPYVFGTPHGNINRFTNSYAPWYIANGVNQMDCNVGSTCAGGTIYQNSTISIGGNGSSPNGVIINVSGSPGANAYQGYMIIKYSGTGTPGIGKNASIITSSDAVTNSTVRLEYAAPDTGEANRISFVAGEHYQIRRVDHGLDQPGRGRGDRLDNGSGTAQPLNLDQGSIIADANQDVEPLYSWNNHNGSMGGALIGGWTSGLIANGPVRLNREVIANGIPRPSPYPHPSPAPSPCVTTSGNKAPCRVGPDAEMEPGVTGQYVDPSDVYGYRYPHPNVLGLPNDTTAAEPPSISPRSSSWTIGVAKTLTFTSSGFTGENTFTHPGGTLPANLVFADGPNGTATISGTVQSGTILGDRNIDIVATNTATTPDEVASLTAANGNPFVLTVLATAAPTPAVAMTAPSPGAAYIEPANVPLAATASISNAQITAVEFYRAGSGTPIATVNAPGPYSTTWTQVAAGSYSLTAKAYADNSTSTISSPAVAITVAAPTPTPTPTPFSPTPTPTPIGPTPTPPARIILQP